MKALVVYDSVSGNTEKVAEAIASGIAGGTRAVRANAPDARDLAQVALLVIGSPTQGGRATENVRSFVANLPAVPGGMKVAAFDTRLKMKFVKLFGFAADRIAGGLKEKGIPSLEGSEGFIVKGRTGPLAEGELERAAAWGRKLAGSAR